MNKSQLLNNGTEHGIGLFGTKPNNWPPTADNNTAAKAVTVTQQSRSAGPGGDWSVNVHNKDKKNDDICTGAEGPGVDDGITWTVTFVACGREEFGQGDCPL